MGQAQQHDPARVREFLALKRVFREGYNWCVLVVFVWVNGLVWVGALIQDEGAIRPIRHLILLANDTITRLYRRDLFDYVTRRMEELTEDRCVSLFLLPVPCLLASFARMDRPPLPSFQLLIPPTNPTAT